MCCCFKRAATPGRSETCGCAALCQPAVCVSKHVPIRVCLCVPTFVQTPLCCTFDTLPGFSFYYCRFLLLRRARSLHCGRTLAHVRGDTGAKSPYAHTFAHTRRGSAARIRPDLSTYSAVCPFRYGKRSMSDFTCSQTLLLVGFIRLRADLIL